MTCALSNLKARRAGAALVKKNTVVLLADREHRHRERHLHADTSKAELQADSPQFLRKSDSVVSREIVKVEASLGSSLKVHFNIERD